MSPITMHPEEPPRITSGLALKWHVSFHEVCANREQCLLYVWCIMMNGILMKGQFGWSLL